jgi:hypothetical protein
MPAAHAKPCNYQISSGRHALAALYPLKSGLFRHDLADHPLLTLAALADAASAMRPDHVEHRSSAAQGFTHFDTADCGTSDVIRNISDYNCWVMLRFIEQLPEYRDLLQSTLEQFAEYVEPQTGPMRDMRAFVFISTQSVVTPFHFDPEYNILFHIAGQKSFATFPAEPPYVDMKAHERLHVDGDNLLYWHDEYRSHAVVNHLGPGDALYVPYKLPHIVAVEGGPSISISMTWKSDWSAAQDSAYRFNAAMRQLGLPPRPVPEWPHKTPLRNLGSKVLQRLGLPK